MTLEQTVEFLLLNATAEDLAIVEQLILEKKKGFARVKTRHLHSFGKVADLLLCKCGTRTVRKLQNN